MQKRWQRVTEKVGLHEKISGVSVSFPRYSGQNLQRKRKKKRQRNRGINSLETKANLYFPLVLKEVPLPPLYVLYD